MTGSARGVRNVLFGLPAGHDQQAPDGRSRAMDPHTNLRHRV